MIGRLIKLALLVVILLGVWRIGEVSLAHYRFSDEVDQIAQRSMKSDVETVRAAVMEAAGTYDVPLAPDTIAVRIQGEHCYIDLTYVRPIEVLPRYKYPWSFDVHAHGWELATGGLKKH
jgi:hypothetical protein